MVLSFHRIAYERLEVCNGVTMAAIERAVTGTGLGEGARIFDLGCGNAMVSIALARRFGVNIDAIEADPSMAELARERIAQARVGDRVTVHQARSGDALETLGTPDLIMALGATDPAGLGRATPVQTFTGLAGRLAPGGWLLWGDLTWKGEPPTPLRTVTEITNLYTDDGGWRDAADHAELQVVWSETSPQEVWDAYVAATVGSAGAWLAAHPNAPEAGSVRASRDRVNAMFEFGRPWLSFGLYLMRKPIQRPIRGPGPE